MVVVFLGWSFLWWRIPKIVDITIIITTIKDIIIEIIIGLMEFLVVDFCGSGSWILGFYISGLMSSCTLTIWSSEYVGISGGIYIF